MIPIPLKFTQGQYQEAANKWSCNCGPTALAAMAGYTLDDVRISIPGFDKKHYTSITMMYAGLESLGIKYTKRKDKEFPAYGLCRIQWEGPWTEPSKHWSAKQRHTHWIGCINKNQTKSFQYAICNPDENWKDLVGIFDCNCLNNGSGFVSLKDWENIIVPWLLNEVEPNANGKWHITHSLEITLDS